MKEEFEKGSFYTTEDTVSAADMQHTLMACIGYSMVKNDLITAQTNEKFKELLKTVVLPKLETLIRLERQHLKFLTKNHKYAKDEFIVNSSVSLANLLQRQKEFKEYIKSDSK